jgi:hypothetical protein
MSPDCWCGGMPPPRTDRTVKRRAKLPGRTSLTSFPSKIACSASSTPRCAAWKDGACAPCARRSTACCTSAPRARRSPRTSSGANTGTPHPLAPSTPTPVFQPSPPPARIMNGGGSPIRGLPSSSNRHRILHPIRRIGPAGEQGPDREQGSVQGTGQGVDRGGTGHLATHRFSRAPLSDEQCTVMPSSVNTYTVHSPGCSSGASRRENGGDLAGVRTASACPAPTSAGQHMNSTFSHERF